MFARSSSSSHLGARDLSLDFYSFPVPQLVDFLHRCYKRQTQICNNVAQSWQKISTWRKRKSRMHYWLIIFLSNFDRISHADEIARIGGCRHRREETKKWRGILSRLVGADDFHSEKQLRPRRCALRYAEITRLAIFQTPVSDKLPLAGIAADLSE